MVESLVLRSDVLLTHLVEMQMRTQETIFDTVYKRMMEQERSGLVVSMQPSTLPNILWKSWLLSVLEVAPTEHP